jgi:hypothetical protein
MERKITHVAVNCSRIIKGTGLNPTVVVAVVVVDDDDTLLCFCCKNGSFRCLRRLRGFAAATSSSVGQ